MAIKLCNFGTVDRERRIYFFQFLIHKFSRIKRSKLSDFFWHEGQLWKLQLLKRNGNFGLFLRWYATKEDYSFNPKPSCTAQATFHVINRTDSKRSIHHGDRGKDEYLVVSGGIGYGKIARLRGLHEISGYLIEDTLLVELQLRVNSCCFEDTILLQKSTINSRIACGSFPYFGSHWQLSLRILDDEKSEGEGDWLFLKQKPPQNDDNNDSDKETIHPPNLQKREKYLLILSLEREGNEESSLRHDTGIALSIDDIFGDRRGFKFHSPDNLSYKSKVAIDSETLSDMIQRASLKLTVSFFKTTPYFFYGYRIQDNKRQDMDFNDECQFVDHQHLPWELCLKKDEGGKVSVVIKPDLSIAQNILVSGKQTEGCLKSLWRMSILNRGQEEDDLTLSSEEPDAEKAITKEQDKPQIVPINVSFSKLVNPASLYMDEDNNSLFVFISVQESNFIHPAKDQKTWGSQVEKDIADLYKIKDIKKHRKMSQEILRQRISESPEDLMVDKDLLVQQYESDLSSSVRQQLNESPEDLMVDKDLLVQQYESDLSKSEERLCERNVLINSLQERLNHFENYVDNLHRYPEEARKLYQERSIKKLIETSHPHQADVRILLEISRTLEEIFKDSSIGSIETLVAGALGQDTVTRGKLQLDIVLFFKEDPFPGNKLQVSPDVITDMKEVVHSYSNRSDADDSSTNSATTLPTCSNFLSTTFALLFRCAGVSVALLPAKHVNGEEDYRKLYDMCLEGQRDHLHKHILSVSKRQIEFISRQPQKCKDLIRVVKRWADQVSWQSVKKRPNSYLLTLLVIDAYRRIAGDSIAKTPSFEKEVLTEFALIINEKDLEVRFDDYYDPEDFPMDIWDYPIVQDPALPNHNVAMTGIIDWQQLRRESAKWVRTLCH